MTRAAMSDVVRREVGQDEFQRAVGMPLNAQPSLAKILWLRRSIDAAATAVRFLSLPEWGVVCFGGEPVSELSLASRTGLLDIGALAPFAGAVALAGRNLLSELVQAGDRGRDRRRRIAPGEHPGCRADGRGP